MKDVWDPTIPVEKSHYYNEDDPIAYHPSIPLISNGEPTLIDLFSGCGGISCGFEMAGFKTLLGVDIHSPSIASFRKNHPEAAAVLGDIAKVTEANVHSLIGKNSVTAISAGVPCQGFSLSNRKRWQDDDRNFLFREFVRFVDMLNPEVIMLENVSGMRSVKGGQFVRDITQAMSEAGNGYIVESRLLNSADYGVPQTRKRLIFIGHKNDGGGTYKFKWPEPTHVPQILGQQRLFEDKPGYVTVGEAFCDLPRLERGGTARTYAIPVSKASSYARLMRGRKRTFENHEASQGTVGTSERVSRTKQGEPMYDKFRQRIRLHMQKPSPTVVSGGIRPQFQYGHPLDARGLTVRERARLMSFPDDFVFDGGVVMGRVQTGQAVPPLLAKAVAEQVLKIITPPPLRPTYTVVYWGDAIADRDWFRDDVDVPLLKDAEYLSVEGAEERWPDVTWRPWMDIANPDLVILRGDEQIAMLEVTTEINSGHNALQRFERIYRTAFLGMCAIYVQPLGGWSPRWSAPRGANLRLNDATQSLETLFPECSAMFVPNPMRRGLTPWLSSAHPEVERRANFEIDPNSNTHTLHVRSLLTTLLEGLENDLSLSEANGLVRASPTHATLLANVQTFIDHWEQTDYWQGRNITYRENNSLPPGQSVTILPLDETEQRIRTTLGELGINPDNVVRFRMGGRGRIRTEDRAGDPYAGAALCYRSIYLDDHHREGIFVMYLPDVSIDVYNSLLGSNSQNKAMRLYPIAADVIVFSDGHVDTRNTTM